MNYICPSFKEKKQKSFIEDAIVGFGGFLYVLTAEKILVINDLGPQYQDLRHMGGRKCSHFAAARALQLLPRFQMQLVWVANFYLFARDPWCYANVTRPTTSSFQKFKECFVKCIVFASKELGSVLRPSLFSTDSLIIGWYVIRCSFEAMGNAAEFFSKKHQAIHYDRWYGMQT